MTCLAEMYYGERIPTELVPKVLLGNQRVMGTGIRNSLISQQVSMTCLAGGKAVKFGKQLRGAKPSAPATGKDSAGRRMVPQGARLLPSKSSRLAVISKNYGGAGAP